ncbi:hypothetical protein NLJ89_g9932 [Agrocybe chaxingu]|uniref:Uncharacterized protein n=1 Tax=Agrocybe chaxingu TaxID=84603 RepID=A0A9W8JV14_9AGAR|nr:hypothetical protein NLJ89_g9932 [Agrocybe chaxingu]
MHLAIASFDLCCATHPDRMLTLEKIYLYSRSKASFHRIFITHSLPEYLQHVTPQEAVEYVLPLLSNLVVDDEEEVKEALASEFVSIIWWFFTHCQIVPDDPHPEEAYASSSTTVTISVQAFTPILGTLLLSSKAKAYAITRAAIVKLLLRMKKLDLRESGAYTSPQRHSSDPNLHPWGILPNNRDDDDEDEDAPLPIGLFGTRERSMFTEEILQHVVIGMAQLDMDMDVDMEIEGNAGLSPPPALSSPPMSPRNREYDNSNPYFPPIPQPLSTNSSSRSSSSGSGNGYSSNTESPATSRSHSASPSRPGALNFGPAATSHLAASGPGVATEIDDRWEELADQEEPSEAAGGRLSSMSLIASIVSSVAPLDRETLVSLISEVQRVVKDPVVWVRRECSFALGALAKVIPDDLITSTLLPIFDDVRWDAVWAVRHSALYALPAILARLSPAQRKTLALETIGALSADQHPVVRRGALEALGEVIHTFKADATGPPEELVHLFMGRKEDRRVRDGQQEKDQNPEPPKDAREAFFTDPQRPLICAFNFPAVVLTLGPDRWAEVRHIYLDLADNQNDRVRATLAASAGVLAKLIGADNARSDVVDFWWTAFRSGSATIRGNALESLQDLLGAVGPQVGQSVLEGLIKEWKGIRNYRERDYIQQKLSDWGLWDTDARVALYELVMLGVEDDTAAVRAAAIANIPLALSHCSSLKEVSEDFSGRLEQLASSDSSRSRITFIDCQQQLILGADAGHSLVSLDDDIICSVANLANDDIEGVRIRVARLAALVYRILLRQSHPISTPLDELIRTLSQDVSHGVRRLGGRDLLLSGAWLPFPVSLCPQPNRRPVPHALFKPHIHEAIMFNLLKFLRYLVFPSTPAKQIDAYLIFVGASGLFLIFPILFFQLYGKDVFLGRVWFELLWVGLFWMMELAGAAAVTSQSSLCNTPAGNLLIQVVQESPCPSAQVLQAFTWICAILLLGYFTLLSILSFVKSKEDPTIWHCSVHRFPWMNGIHSLKSAPTSPTSPTLPRFRSKAPVIAAPRPQRVNNLANAFLAYRSGLSSEYEIEYYQPDAQPVSAQISERPIPPVPAEIVSRPSQIRHTTQQAQETQPPIISTPFYHSVVQTAIDKNQPTTSSVVAPPQPAQLGQIRRLPASPPPLGDWPRLDATQRPYTKRKPLPQPQPSQPHPRPEPQAEEYRPRRQSRARATSPTASGPVDAPTLSAALESLAASQLPSASRRSRPGGPRRHPSDDNRPPNLDLSKISTFRSPGFS